MLTPLQQRREAIVQAHVAAENNHDVGAALRTFHHARYEVVPFGGATDGTAAVEGLLSALFAAFPDFHVALDPMHHSDRAVIVEITMKGTQQGPWMGLPASGRPIDVRPACIFEFDDDRLMCEKVYFDNATLMRQLSESATAV